MLWAYGFTGDGSLSGQPNRGGRGPVARLKARPGLISGFFRCRGKDSTDGSAARQGATHADRYFVCRSSWDSERREEAPPVQQHDGVEV